VKKSLSNTANEQMPYFPTDY